MEKDKLQGTQVYDQIFWTVINQLPKFLHALINEAFGTHYTSQAKVTLKAGKQVLNWPGEGLTRREEDALISVEEMGQEEDFHFECETDGRRTVALRIVQYAAGHAAQNATMLEDGAIIQIPNSAIIFLRSDSTNIRELTMWIKYPGGTVSYKVPVLKIKNYTVEELFQKKLFLLIPFAVFSFSDEDFARMDGTNIRELKEMIDDIGGRLNHMAEVGEIEPWERGNLIQDLKTVLEKLTVKYENVTKEAMEAMGGYIFKTDIDIAMEEGRAEGEDKLANALDYWSEQGHEDEVLRALKDKSIREKILEEYQRYCLTQAATV